MMSGILSDLQNVYNAIKYLDDLRTSIEGNKERCRLLIERCNLFSEKISTMIKNTSLYRGNKSGILSLIETVDKCTEFVKKYGKKGWKRKCLNIAFAKDIETEFRDLNNSLQLASSDLQFFILIEKSAFEEDRRACEIDMFEIVSLIAEDANKSGKTTDEILATCMVQLQEINNVKEKVNEFNQIVSTLQMFLERSNAIISLAESPTKKSASTSSRREKSSMETILKFTELDTTILDSVNKELIGRGQYGMVYSCRYDNRQVAMKEFPAFGQQADEVIRKIKREAAIMSLLRHKNIINFEGLSLKMGVIVMELAHCSLFNHLHNKESYAMISPTTKVPVLLSKLMICADIANGIRYLHFHKILHRDLKSANILLFLDSERENNIVAKISDFGIAFVVGSTSTMTSAGGGTLGYFSLFSKIIVL